MDEHTIGIALFHRIQGSLGKKVNIPKGDLKNYFKQKFFAINYS